jgi:hypothetical protein
MRFQKPGLQSFFGRDMNEDSKSIGSGMIIVVVYSVDISAIDYKNRS